MRPRSSSTLGEGEKSMAAGYLSDDPPMPDAELPDDQLPVRVAKRVRWQAYWCGRLGSPLYSDLLSRVADAISAGAPFRALMTDRAIIPLSPNLPPLRLMGSVTRLVLTGLAPEMSWEALASR